MALIWFPYLLWNNAGAENGNSACSKIIVRHTKIVEVPPFVTKRKEEGIVPVNTHSLSAEQQKQQRRRRSWLCLPSAVGGCCLGGRNDVMHRSIPDQRGADNQEEGWTSNHPSHSRIPPRALARLSPFDGRKKQNKTHPSIRRVDFGSRSPCFPLRTEEAMRPRSTPDSRRRGCWERASCGRRCCWWDSLATTITTTITTTTTTSSAASYD